MKLNSKKLKSLLIAGSLVAAIGISGTLAYLTDRDSEANVFTVGDVEIDLNEDFEQGAELIPGVDIEKKATITNTGKNDAWVWLTVLLPEEMGPYTAPGNMSASNNVVHWNYPKESAANITVDFNSTPVEVDTDGDGVDESYYQTNMLWKNVLEAGDTTGVMLSKVYMDTRVDIDPDGNMYWVVDGEATDLGWNVNEKGNPVIHVSAYAIQKEGFDTVADAYAAYNTQWGDNGTEYGTPATLVNNADDLATALAAGGNVALTEDINVGDQVFVVNGGVLDGNGKTLTVSSGTEAYESGLTVTEGTAKNVTVTGAFRGLGVGGSGASEMTGDVTYENVTVTGATYGINIGIGNGHKITMKNCTLGDWNSYSGLSGAEFTGCTFTSAGNYYASQRISANATFTYTNCKFEQNTYNNTAGTENYYLDSYGNGTIVLENCYMGDTLITESNVKTLFQIDPDKNTTVVVNNN